MVVSQVGSTWARWPVGWRLELPEGVPPGGGFPLVLALHGHGHDGATFGERLTTLRGSPLALALLDAPFPITVERPGRPSRIGRSWYAYDGDQETFRRSVDFLEGHLLAALDDLLAAAPLDSSRVALLGYSQGGYAGSLVALRRPDRFRALVAASCRIKVEWFPEGLSAARGFPILGVHGREDDLTRLEPQRQAFDQLEAWGLDATLIASDGGHAFDPAWGALIRDFLVRVFGATT